MEIVKRGRALVRFLVRSLAVVAAILLILADGRNVLISAHGGEVTEELAAPAPASPGQVVPVNFDIPTTTYVSFMNELRGKLANHPNPEDVKGHPVLAKQRPRQPPARWMHCDLSTGKDKEKAKVTLAVRDDNLYLIGFKAASGKWYEFGKEGEDTRMIAGSTFLECGPDYRSLVGGATSKKVKENLTNLQLSKSLAEDAVKRLSAYAQPASGGPDDATKLALARLIVVVCESARMTSISNTVNGGWAGAHGSKITEQQVDYLWNWGLMSRALLEWKQQGDKYKWPPALTKIGVKNAQDALNVVYLLLKPLSMVEAAAAAENEDDEVLLLGQPLVEVFA